MRSSSPSLEALERFRRPSAEFKVAAFWFWHRLPTEAETRHQVADMAATGIGTVMIQARLAMRRDTYLSAAYLAAYRFAAAAAREHGVRIEIYDEYMWMSGHGGGRTVAGADHLRERHLFWATAEPGETHIAVSGIRSSFLDFLGDAGRAWAYDGGRPRWDEWELVAAVHHPPATAGLDEAGPVPATAIALSGGDDGCGIGVDRSLVPNHRDRAVTVFVAARCASSRLVNYLMPEAASRFAQTVYEPLLAVGGKDAGGFFFDHPYAGFYRWAELAGDLGNSLLWDARLPVLLRGASPEDDAALGLGLLALTRDVGPRTAKLRCGFFETYGDRLHEAFFGTLSRWTRARGLGFTGHELLPHVGAWGLHAGLGGFDPRTMPGVDVFGIDAYRTTTAVDAADYAPQLSAKLGDSIARANGRKRCTIEQYSTGRETGAAGLAGQWGLTLQRFRAQAIRHLLFGARQILLHAVCVTDGDDTDPRLGLNPRFDFPPGFNFQPWWEDCPQAFAELARLSVFLEDGDPLRPVALLYPLESIRAEAMTPDCGRHFGWWAEALARAGIGYDVIDERALAAADASDGHLGTATGRYDTLILPAVTTLGSTGSAERIAAFVSRGGRLLVSGPHPSKTKEIGEDPRLAGLFADLLHRHSGSVLHMPSADQASVVDAVARLPRPRPSLRLADGPSWNAVARFGDTWRIAVFNDADHGRTLAIAVDEEPRWAARWHPETGEVVPVEADYDAGVLSLDLPAQGLICLVIGEGPAVRPRAPQAPAPEDWPPVVLEQGWRFKRRDDGAEAVPIDVGRGWEEQGFAEFSGTGLYLRDLDLPALPGGAVWHLLLPKVRDTVECRVDGVCIGRHIAGEAVFPLPDRVGRIALALHVRNTGANRYYAGTPFWDGVPRPSGLLAPPRLEARRRPERGDASSHAIRE